MVSGQSIECEFVSFSNDMSIPNNKHDVFVLLVHLGYLSVIELLPRKHCLVRIPNYEILEEFEQFIEFSENYADIYALQRIQISF